MKIYNLTENSEWISTIAPWHHEEWGYLNPDRLLQDRIDKFHSHLGTKAIPTTLVAVEDGEVCGSASIVDSDMNTHPELGPWLASVYVKSSERGRGIGAKLVNKIVEFACTTEYKELYLFTPSSESFYRKLGWEKVADEEYSGSIVTIMKIAVSKIK